MDKVDYWNEPHWLLLRYNGCIFRSIFQNIMVFLIVTIMILFPFTTHWKWWYVSLFLFSPSSASSQFLNLLLVFHLSIIIFLLLLWVDAVNYQLIELLSSDRTMFCNGMKCRELKELFVPTIFSYMYLYRMLEHAKFEAAVLFSIFFWFR